MRLPIDKMRTRARLRVRVLREIAAPRNIGTMERKIKMNMAAAMSKTYVSPPRAPRKNPEIAIINPPRRDNAKLDLGGGFCILEKTNSVEAATAKTIIPVIVRIVFHGKVGA